MKILNRSPLETCLFCYFEQQKHGTVYMKQIYLCPVLYETPGIALLQKLPFYITRLPFPELNLFRKASDIR